VKENLKEDEVSFIKKLGWLLLLCSIAND